VDHLLVPPAIIRTPHYENKGYYVANILNYLRDSKPPEEGGIFFQRMFKDLK
jgi:hypothetical protein